MGLKVFTTPSIPLTGDRNPSRKGKDVTALQGFFLKSSRPSLLIKRAALGNLKASFHCTYWHRFFPLKKAFSKTYPSFLTLKEGSTSHPDPLTLREEGGNRYALRLADQSGLRHILRDGTAGRGKFTVNSLQLIFGGFC